MSHAATYETMNPIAIVREINSLLDLKTVPSEIADSTLILAGFCPCPPTPSGIALATALIASLQPVNCPLSMAEIERLNAYWSTRKAHDDTNSQRQLATRYPVTHALKRIESRYQNADTNTRCLITSIFLQLTQFKSDDLMMFSPTTYYHDVLSIRDALIGNIPSIDPDHFAFDDLTTLRSSIADQNNSAIRKLTGDDQDTEPNVSKIRTLQALLTSDRTIGIPSRYRTSPIEVTTSEAISENDELLLPDGDTYRLIEINSRGDEYLDPDDREGKCHLQRNPGTSGSRATSGDDLRNHRAIYESIEASNIISLSDMSKLPLVTVRRFLAIALETSALLFAYVWLLVTTGIHPSRLVLLGCEPNTRAANTGVHLDTLRGILSFEVLGDAPDRSSERENPNIVRLILPQPIFDIIILNNKDIPFENIDSELDIVSRRFASQQPGIRPTPINLARTYRTLVAPLLKDDCLSATLPGMIPCDFRAQSAYYRFENSTLNQAWQAAIRTLCTRLINGDSCTPRLKTLLRGLTYATHPVSGTLGSRKAVPARQLHPVAQNISVKAGSLQQKIKDAPFLDSLENLVELANLQSANRFMMQIFMHALRPVAMVARTEPADETFGAWVKDKNSGLYGERRLTPFKKDLARQIKHCDQMKRRIRKASKLEKTSIVEDTDATERHLALHYEITIPRKAALPELHIRTMTTQHFRDVLGSHQIPFDFPDNINRHVTPNEKSSIAPQSYLDQLLGHTRAGHDIFSPYSSASLSPLVTSDGTSTAGNSYVSEDSGLIQFPFDVVETEV